MLPAMSVLPSVPLPLLLLLLLLPPVSLLVFCGCMEGGS
jgi:hypothetical protein